MHRWLQIFCEVSCFTATSVLTAQIEEQKLQPGFVLIHSEARTDQAVGKLSHLDFILLIPVLQDLHAMARQM